MIKSNILSGLTLIFLIVSCLEDNETAGLTAYNASVVSYFKEVALGFEFGNASEVTRRWEGNMKVFVGGNPSHEILEELQKIMGEINQLSTTDFVIESVTDTLESNFYIFFGSGSAFANTFPEMSGLVGANFGLFTVYWNGANELFKGYMYVDLYRATQTEQLHLLREELTQSLGLAKDSEKYSESIFQQSFATKTTEYAQIDRDLIRLLYHPEMDTGLNEGQVDTVLREILLAEQ
jgi:hypothetical protein